MRFTTLKDLNYGDGNTERQLNRLYGIIREKERREKEEKRENESG